jgi:PTS system nitrogen regulatory IIA component
MSNEPYSASELAVRLGRDCRDVEKAADRGRIPGRKIGGQWQFHPAEIRQWLEVEMRAFTPEELAAVEGSHRSHEIDPDKPLSSLLSVETVEVPLDGRTKRGVLEALVTAAGRTHHVWDPAAVLEAVLAREEAGSTAYELGVAIPHPRNPLPEILGDSVIAFGRTLSGIPFGGPKRSLTDLFFLVLCRDPRTHLQVLARLGRMLQQPDFPDALRAAETPADALRIIQEAEAATT